MSQTRVYITPFLENGTYGAEVDVTNDIQSISSIGVDTDSSEYQIGVFRNSSVKLDLNNREGMYSDVTIAQSIFRYTRSDSKVRITYLEDDLVPYCGTAICGLARLCEEITVFRGLLSDDSLTEEAKIETVSFQVLGYESLFARVAVPFASLSIGDLMSEIMFSILNQEVITDVLTVSALNINPSLDLAVDSVAELENQTGKSVLDTLLLLSNSVLYIDGTTVYVTPRTATVATQQTFYGQASNAGAENVMNVRNITSGKNRVFNYIAWRDSTSVFQSSPSVRVHGVRKKEIDSPMFTNPTKRLAILEELVTEFGFPKQELELLTQVDAVSSERKLLDRIAIDYPTVYVEGDFDFPVCGIAVCGDPISATLPRALWSLQIPSTRRYKIIKKTLDFKSMVATFKLREI